MTPQTQKRLVDLSDIAPEALVLLDECGAMERPHSGRTLFDHLVGTYGLLREWGNSESICLGGLFHSIYGTNAFRHQSLPHTQRPLLQKYIGREAESLAWNFCNIERPWAIISALRSTAQAPEDLSELQPNWSALAEIEVANLIEQADKGRGLRELYFLTVEHEGVLSSMARRALKSFLSTQLTPKQQNTTTLSTDQHTMLVNKERT